VRAFESNRKKEGEKGGDEGESQKEKRRIKPCVTCRSTRQLDIIADGGGGELINGGTGFLGEKSPLLVSISFGELTPRKDLTSLITSWVSYFSTLRTAT